MGIARKYFDAIHAYRIIIFTEIHKTHFLRKES